MNPYGDLNCDGISCCGGYAPTYNPSLKLWICGDNVVADSSNLVSQADDQSGLGHHFTATAKPTRVLNALNGHAVLDFNGTSQYLTTGSLTLPVPLHHVFVVKLRPNNNTNPHRLIDQTVTSAPTALIYTDATSIYGNFNNATPYPSIATTASAWAIIDYVVTSSYSKLGKNGGTQVSGAGSSLSMNGILLCAYASLGDYFGSCQIAEYLCFTAELTGTARLQECARLACKYGLQLAA